jgi:PKD repeat protein
MPSTVISRRSLGALLLATGTALVALPMGSASAAGAPIAPSNLSAVPTPNSSIVVAWADNSADETAFEIERCTNGNSFDISGNLVLTGCTDATGFAPRTTAAAGTVSIEDRAFGNYSYRVRAVNASGASAWTPIVHSPSAGIVPQVRLTAPATATATVAATFNSAGTTVALGTIAKLEWSFGDGTTALGATVSHAYAAAGSYAVVLTATDSNGNTNSARATVTVAAAPLATPSNLTATSAVKRRVDLKWTLPANSGATTLTVLRCTGASCSFFGYVVALPGTATSFSDTTVKSGTTYRYVVSAQFPTGSTTSAAVTTTAR